MIPSTIVSQAKSSPFPFLLAPDDETSDDVSLELPPVNVESSITYKNVTILIHENILHIKLFYVLLLNISIWIPFLVTPSDCANSR